MGRLGLELSETTWVSENKKIDKPEISFRDIPTVSGKVEEKDGLGDKCLAYISYYALVFVACCIFIPAQTSLVFAATADVFKSDFLDSTFKKEINRNHSKLLLQSSDWVLRGVN